VSAPAYNVDEHRLEAELLQRDLQNGIGAAALRAAKRFQILEAWRKFSAKEIRDTRAAITLKDAQRVVALENGSPSWDELEKATADVPIAFRTSRLFPEKSDVFLNRWYRSYHDAQTAHQAEPDLLLFPHGDQFVLCEPALIGWIGGDPRDPDWEKIGRDWVQPKDENAKQRLAARLHRALR
jgi:hypothetical protein